MSEPNPSAYLNPIIDLLVNAAWLTRKEAEHHAFRADDDALGTLARAAADMDKVAGELTLLRRRLQEQERAA